MAKLKKIYDDIFEKIASEVSRCQNTTLNKAVLNVIANGVHKT